MVQRHLTEKRNLSPVPLLNTEDGLSCTRDNTVTLTLGSVIPVGLVKT